MEKSYKNKQLKIKNYFAIVILNKILLTDE